MDENRPFSRRQFLVMVGTLLAGTGLPQACRLLSRPTSQAEQAIVTPQATESVSTPATASQVTETPLPASPTPTATPVETPTPSPTATPLAAAHRVIHVRDPEATNWYGTGAFYHAVNRHVVNAMVLTGLQWLTDQNNWGDIWGLLFGHVHSGGYSAGQKIAIKVNFNNSGRAGNGCDTHTNQSDALPHPVLALISGMVTAGVRASDIIVYDATFGGEATVPGRIIPDYFRDPIAAAYSGVSFVGQEVCLGVVAASHGKHASLTVQFNDPDGNLSDRQLADVLYDATYVINVPILKRHGGDNYIPVSLGFKNHLGSIDRVVKSRSDSLHDYMETSEPLYRATYNPVVDIWYNPHIRDKTVLILGDGLYGAFSSQGQTPTHWNTFDDAPNSLFFATDPVAIDCVMADFLVAEGCISTAHAYDYMFCAAEVGLGVCEGKRDNPGGDPWQRPYGSGYDSIDYVRVGP